MLRLCRGWGSPRCLQMLWPSSSSSAGFVQLPDTGGGGSSVALVLGGGGEVTFLSLALQCTACPGHVFAGPGPKAAGQEVGAEACSEHLSLLTRWHL